MTRRIELAPGDYTVRNITAGTTSTVTVPVLTVAIVQTSPTVGQTLTLTTNAAPGAAYQWRRGGTPISGATSATYTTVSADAGQVLTCRVVSGVQDVTSAGVTVGAAASFSAAFVAGSFVNNTNEFQGPKTFPGVAIGEAAASRRLYLPVFMTREQSRPVTMSVNGGPGISPLAQVRDANFRQCLLFPADVPTGTTADFTIANDGGSLDMGTVGLAVIRVVGNHTALTATDASGGTPATVPIATNAGDTLFVMFEGSETGVTFSPPSGYTAHVNQSLRAPDGPLPQILLASGIAAGGAPEVISAPVSAFQFYAALALRLRAA
jgi:hypothetical protein